MMEEGDRCNQCGTKASEWADDRFAYVPESYMCLGCYYLDAANENNKNPEGKTMPGTQVKLVANTPQKQAEIAAHAEQMRSMTQE